MMHYRTAYPHDLDEICGIFPVKDKEPGEKKGQEIVKAFKHALTLLDEHAKKGEYPVTYGLYFRYLQGTNGGLSFTAHPEGHHVCAMDLTTIRNAPGFAEFKKNMQKFFVGEMKAKFHWGKNAPTDINYAELYGPAWHDTKRALESWHKLHHISTVKSALLNPMFSETLGYPAPTLIDTDVKMIAFAANTHVTAVQAKKLMDVIGDKSAEAQKIQALIDRDIEKRALAMNSTFKDTSSATAQPVIDNADVKEATSSCVLL